MRWDDYRKAMDELPFDPDFQARTVELLRLSTQKESKKEVFPMKKKWIHRIAAVAAVIALLTVSAYAATHLLSPSQVAEFAGNPLLAEAFQSEDAVIVNQSVETGDFRVTLAGLVSGKGLDGFDENVDQDRTYAVMSLERLDGVALDQQDFPFTSYTLTPLVSGYTPWSVNNWTLDASAQGVELDGVYYYLLDTQSLEMFADHTVYLAFYEGSLPSQGIFAMEADGSIVFQPDYTAPHALFTIPLDASKADPAAVDAFIENSGFDREWFTHYEPATGEPEVAGSPAESESSLTLNS